MCVEAYFLINLLMDFSIFTAVARSLGSYRFRRILAASGLSAVYAVLARLTPLLAAVPAQMVLLAPVSALTAGRGPHRMKLCAGTMILTTAFAAGTGAALAAHGFSPWLSLIPQAMTVGARLRREFNAAGTAIIEVNGRGTSARFPACVDTGNRLREPLSGQPVMIVSAALVERVLPASGFRQVGYGSIGGAGALPCFRPERIYIDDNGRRHPAPEAWVAVYPGKLPGPFQALAPAEFTLY